MIDRSGRNLLAEQLRHLAAGVVTVAEYERRTEDLALASPDPALPAVWHAAWGLYDDFGTERLRGEWALSPENRRAVARWILFLYSDQEYRWRGASVAEPVGCLMGLFGRGWWERIAGGKAGGEPPRPTAGAMDVWPFGTPADLAAARGRRRGVAPRPPRETVR